jgi:hypothetical protein
MRVCVWLLPSQCLTRNHTMWKGLLFALAAFHISSAVGQGVGINAQLCNLSPSSAESTLTSSMERIFYLHVYLRRLESGIYDFDGAVTPEEAVSKFGLGLGGQATYGLLLEEANKLVALNGSVNTDQAIRYLRGIIDDEESIGRLGARAREKYGLSILYLRALQDGVCAFPYALDDVPTASVVINQIAKAYQGVHVDDDPIFQNVYKKTIVFAANELRQRGVVSVFRIIEEWRRGILRLQEDTPNSLPR